MTGRNTETKDRSAADEFLSGVNAGRTAAESAKHIARAAAKAAAQDYAGAAAEAVKSGTVRRILSFVLAGVFLLCVICVLFLYSLPTMIFEAVQTFFSHLKDTYDEVLYSGVYGDVTESHNFALLITAGEAVRTLWSSLFYEDEDEAVIDRWTDAPDLYITQSEADETETLNGKIDATVLKLEARAGSLAQELRNNAGLISRYDSLISNYTAPDGTIVRSYVNISTDTSSASARLAAIRLLALYTVQTGANITDIRISDYQQWLGYETGSLVPRGLLPGGITDGYWMLLSYGIRQLGKTDILLTTRKADGTAGAGYTIRVTPWQGTCLPQYAVDQAKYEGAALGAPVMEPVTGCAAVDLYLTVEAPDPSSVQGQVYEYAVPITVYKEVIDESMGHDDARRDSLTEAAEQERGTQAGRRIVTRTVYEYHRDIVYYVTIRITARPMAEMFDILGLTGTEEARTALNDARTR